MADPTPDPSPSPADEPQNQSTPPEEPRPPWEQPNPAGGEAETMDPNDIVAALQNEAAKQHNQAMQQYDREVEAENEPGMVDAPPEEDIWAIMEQAQNQRAQQQQPDRGEHTLSEFEKLCKLGYLEKSFEIGGNTLVIRTLDQKEDFECLSKSGTHPPITQARAYHLYSISRALQTINGEPWFTQISLTEKDNTLDRRFQQIMELKPTILSIIIGEYMSLQDRAIEEAEYARKKS